MIHIGDIKRIGYYCRKYGIVNFCINNDGSIDVNGNVVLKYQLLDKIAPKFNIVSGDFICSNLDLDDLECAPRIVGGRFDCSHNILSDLVNAPIEVGGMFSCYGNNITTLLGAPKILKSDFLCYNNKISSLEHMPSKIFGEIHLHNNSFPEIFVKLWNKISSDDEKILFKYQNEFQIWENGFDQSAFEDLISEIKDGLL